MSDAGRVESMTSPPSIHAHIGPLIPANAVAYRYAVAVGVVLLIFGARALLAPVLGVQAPLLPFLLGVFASAYLGGLGPALLAAAITPILATLGFTGWPNDAPPWQWLAHVAFFLLVAVISAYIMNSLQRAVRSAAASAREAAAAAQSLRETDRRKDEFLAMLAHELRNPLTPIRNVAHILGRAPDADTVKRASEMLERQASHLTHLVDDLLDVARITHRRIDLKRDLVSLDDVVTMALENVQPVLDARHQVVTRTSTSAHVYVFGDEVRLCQVVANLLTNASKYSAEGKPIHVNVGGDDREASITVRDEGVGIDAQLMPRLFDLFMQGDRSLDRAQGGLGIGLTIVKHLVDMHGGTVEASSGGVNQGSEFRIRMPRAERPMDRNNRRAPQRLVRHRRVLLVEDNRDIAESLRDLLGTDGHAVMMTLDGSAALAALDDFAADLVLLDVGLPRMDGYMVAHAIRARFGDRPRPRLVALTGYASEEDKRTALKSGFDEHLTKPVEPEKLLRLVSEDFPAAVTRETAP